MIFILILTAFIFNHSSGNRLELELDLYDRKITQILQNPSPEEGKKLISYIKEYNKKLSYLLYLTDKKDRNVVKIAKQIWIKEGPAFLKLKINNDLLQETFEWDDYDMYQLHFLFGATKILWFDMKELNPKGTPHFREKNYHDLYEIDKKGLLHELIDFTKPDDIT